MWIVDQRQGLEEIGRPTLDPGGPNRKEVFKWDYVCEKLLLTVKHNVVLDVVHFFLNWQIYGTSPKIFWSYLFLTYTKVVGCGCSTVQPLPGMHEALEWTPSAPVNNNSKNPTASFLLTL